MALHPELHNKEFNPDWAVIVGNVVTGEVCITTEDLGIGRAMGSSLRDTVTAITPYKEKYGHIGVIADGGIKLPRHILAALALGADAVMMGTELAGLEESPSQTHYDANTGRMVKDVRGMGSEEAQKGTS